MDSHKSPFDDLEQKEDSSSIWIDDHGNSQDYSIFNSMLRSSKPLRQVGFKKDEQTPDEYVMQMLSVYGALLIGRQEHEAELEAMDLISVILSVENKPPQLEQIKVKVLEKFEDKTELINLLHQITIDIADKLIEKSSF